MTCRDGRDVGRLDRRRAVTGLAAFLGTGLTVSRSTAATGGGPIDRLFFGGPIITVDDARPSAEAVAVRGGRIVGVGARRDLLARFDTRRAEMTDLRGRTLIPGFVDAHSHVTSVGALAFAAELLPPPDGRGSSVAAIQAVLREQLRTSSVVRKSGVLIGWGYDDAQLAERRHPTRQDLDAVSTDVPIMIIHQSGHLGAYNTRALEKAGVGADTPDPPGGRYRRESDGRRPNGVAEEAGHGTLSARLTPRISDDEAMAQLDAAQAIYLKHGHTTVQDGRTGAGPLAGLVKAAEGGRLKVDVVAYPDMVQNRLSSAMQSPLVSRGYANRFRIGGVKFGLDGSPQGKTAWLKTPYFHPPEGQAAGYAGYPAFASDDAFEALLTEAYRKNWQVLAHVNGDAAIDQYIRGIERVSQAVPGRDRRPVAIHAQTLRLDQVEAFRRLGIFPALFPMHTFYWGDWHRDSVLGPERARNISPTGWLLQRGMRFSSHHDAPVTVPDTMRVMAATVNRTTRTGEVLGPEHRVSPLVALKAMTLWSAYQHFEEHQKGSIEVGKRADFVILSDSPLTVPRPRIAEIRVTETIKDGVTLYTRGESA